MAGPWTKMVDVGLTEEEQLEYSQPMASADVPKYPWGLRISLDEKTLEKLGLDEDPEVGDYIDLRAFARVTSASRDQSANGKVSRRVELQIERLAVEDEDREDNPGDAEDID